MQSKNGCWFFFSRRGGRWPLLLTLLLVVPGLSSGQQAESQDGKAINCQAAALFSSPDKLVQQATTIIDESLAQTHRYASELEALDWHQVLDMERIASDVELRETRQILEAGRTTLARYKAGHRASIQQMAQLFGCLPQEQAKHADVVAEVFDQSLEENGRYWALAQRAFSVFERAVEILESSQGRWSIIDGYLTFHYEEDEVLFQEQMLQLDEVEQQFLVMTGQVDRTFDFGAGSLVIPANFVGPTPMPGMDESESVFNFVYARQLPEGEQPELALLDIAVLGLKRVFPGGNPSSIDEAPVEQLLQWAQRLARLSQPLVADAIEWTEISAIPAARIPWQGEWIGVETEGVLYFLIHNDRVVVFSTSDSIAFDGAYVDQAVRAFEAAQLTL